MLFMRNDFRGKEVCKRGRISRANSEGHSNPSLSVGHVPRVIRTPHPPPRQGFGKPRGASAASPRPSPPGDYKSHPALRSRTLRQSKMADTTASAGAGSSGMRSGSKQSTNPADNYHLARRRTLQVVVSSLLTEAGFESAEKASVETLTEMLQSYISEIGRSAKSYCEHTARTQPTLSDIVVTLVEMGFNVDTLPAYAKRSQRMVITAPPVTNQPVTPKALTAGQNRPHPPHIPSHFPEFPDPHTYIKTPTYREPVSDYQVLREKAASQRRDVERALTRFMAKTGETQSLFKDDVSTFPLIAARPFTIPYLTALLPSELEMQQMEETDSSEQEEQTDTENLPLHISTDDSGAEKENTSVLQQNSLSGSRSGEESLIDNPYLRPVKKPKIRRKKLDWGIGAAGDDLIHYHRTSFL
ncbi:transcription initiation factor TFIID subunit 8 isoform X2 [Pipistrellus kuhlii]|uniref:transcription initiation factor TFIID subunit 8 isoform X2 n=1 Tax=Pipistrellus kuhlii TaxID=59472 RepID=UPI00174F1536|nr:transcription initiation factor TFIID subunit 8 isoform X2 [Pipistrellus kuhlii]